MLAPATHSYSFIASKETFAAYATGVAENLMKELVNDWSTAQDLEDLSEPLGLAFAARAADAAI
jgi:hypothetical protein